MSDSAPTSVAGEWYVYIVRASDQSLYTGITTDPERRLVEHQSGKAGAKYFRGRKAVEMVHIEKGYNRSTAASREAVIKKLSRAEKLGLIRK
ncbi:GIY-YIG nuclease family protein [Porticoccaceae bacterium]|jgi:putative endonuclease|nr:GIY-YIG nuclease family protein [Porticoccaceae bacterium]